MVAGPYNVRKYAAPDIFALARHCLQSLLPFHNVSNMLSTHHVALRSNFKKERSGKARHILLFQHKVHKGFGKYDIGVIFVRKYCKILFLQRSHKETSYMLFSKNFYGPRSRKPKSSKNAPIEIIASKLLPRSRLCS